MLQYYDEINSKPLPLITERNGILLPQEGQLINTNYQLKRATHQVYVEMNWIVCLQKMDFFFKGYVFFLIYIFIKLLGYGCAQL